MEMDYEEDTSAEPPRVPALISEEIIHLDPDFCLSMAQSEHSSGNYTKAFEFYVDYLNALPTPQNMRLIELDAMTDMVLAIGQILEEKVECVVKCYTQILNLLPDNAKILNALGVYLCSRGEHAAAKTYLTRAAEAGFLMAEKSLLHILWEIIPRWHFRMLNDLDRNTAFRKAIENALNLGHRNVLDIGTGCGLLSMCALNHCTNATVTTFEEKQVLFKIATKVFQESGKSQSVNIIHSNSNAVCFEKPNASLLVTEIFDAGFFGENCVESIHHSINSHLVNCDELQIIPAGARLYVTAIECPKLHKKHRFQRKYAALQLPELINQDSEPYDCEYLYTEPVKYITNTVNFLDVNFYDFRQMTKLKESIFEIPHVELTCNGNGHINAFALWFDLHLDENIKLSTKPKPDKTCWEQAVFHTDSISIKKDQVMRVQPIFKNPHLSFEFLDPVSEILINYMEASKEMITFLNDESLVNTVVKFAATFTNCSKVKVLDMNIFPLFGLLLARKGATVYYVYRRKCDTKVLRRVMSLNRINVNQIVMISEESVNYEEIRADIIYTNLIHCDGSWNGNDLGLKIKTCPEQIILKIRLIYSEYLDFCNKVEEENVFNTGISKYINEYSGFEHPDLDVTSLNYDPLSEIASIDISDLTQHDFQMSIETLGNGECNGILYWFNLVFTKDNVFDTFNSSHYKKTCTFLQTRKIIKANESVRINVIREENYMKIYCD